MSSGDNQDVFLYIQIERNDVIVCSVKFATHATGLDIYRNNCDNTMHNLFNLAGSKLGNSINANINLMNFM